MLSCRLSRGFRTPGRPSWPVGIWLLIALLWPIGATAAADQRKSPAPVAVDHPQVRSELRRFQGRGRASMDRWLGRGGAYLPMIRRRLAESRLPEDLCWLPLIESGFSNTAVSPKGAAGMWQLMPATARAYGLRVDGLVDERRNPVKATRAALLHLEDLMDQFGSPYLAAAAYNAGSARVLRGLARLKHDSGPPRAAAHADPDSTGVSRRGDGFFRLADAELLAPETRDYVPRFIAASMIGRNPRQYGFSAAREALLPVDSVLVTKATRLDQIAEAAGASAQLVRELNPELIRGVTPPRSRTMVLVPRGLAPDARERIAALPVAEVGPWLFLREPDAPRAPRSLDRARRMYRQRPAREHARVQSGETLEDVARRCGVSSTTLAQVNRLPRDHQLPVGLIIRLP